MRTGVVTISCPPALAAELARGLVDGGLAACVQIIPRIRSLYRWQGRVEDEEESLLLCKTAAARLPLIERFLAEHHPYEVPELLLLPVEGGGAAYLSWMSEVLEAEP